MRNSRLAGSYTSIRHVLRATTRPPQRDIFTFTRHDHHRHIAATASASLAPYRPRRRFARIGNSRTSREATSMPMLAVAGMIVIKIFGARLLSLAYWS